MKDKFNELKHPTFGMFSTYGRPCEVCGVNGYNYVYPENDYDYSELEDLIESHKGSGEIAMYTMWNKWWGDRTMHLCDEHKEVWFDLNKFPRHEKGYRLFPKKDDTCTSE